MAHCLPYGRRTLALANMFSLSSSLTHRRRRLSSCIQISVRIQNRGVQCERGKEERMKINLVNDLTIESNITEMRINKNSAIVSIEMNNAGYFHRLCWAIFGHRILPVGIKDANEHRTEKKSNETRCMRSPALATHIHRTRCAHNRIRSSAGCPVRASRRSPRTSNTNANIFYVDRRLVQTMTPKFRQ